VAAPAPPAVACDNACGVRMLVPGLCSRCRQKAAAQGHAFEPAKDSPPLSEVAWRPCEHCRSMRGDHADQGAYAYVPPPPPKPREKGNRW